ncbi:MAG: leucyl/phenylalanyl-tRNA--protein transferase [Lacipirellulaceae bacterium]
MSPDAAESRFPDPREADSEGLVGYGGSLGVEWLLDAYRHGVFPWPVAAHEPMLWFSPDPRGVLPLDGLHVSRRLRRRLRSGAFYVTIDTAFGEVIDACAEGPGREGGTWITPRMRRAYRRLHEAGHAHSVEVWDARAAESALVVPGHGAPTLVGGVYGVAIGGLFAAESMFHRQTDASKVAVASLVAHLNARGYQLLDIQQVTEHTASLGAIEVPRDEYVSLLAEVVDLPVTFGQKIAPVAW